MGGSSAATNLERKAASGSAASSWLAGATVIAGPRSDGGRFSASMVKPSLPSAPDPVSAQLGRRLGCRHPDDSPGTASPAVVPRESSPGRVVKPRRSAAYPARLRVPGAGRPATLAPLRYACGLEQGVAAWDGHGGGAL